MGYPPVSSNVAYMAVFFGGNSSLFGWLIRLVVRLIHLLLGCKLLSRMNQVMMELMMAIANDIYIY